MDGLFGLNCCSSNGRAGVGGIFYLLDEIGLVESLILFAFVEVLLDDFDLAQTIYLQYFKVLELKIDEFQHLPLDFLLVISPNELTVV